MCCATYDALRSDALRENAWVATYGNCSLAGLGSSCFRFVQLVAGKGDTVQLTQVRQVRLHWLDLQGKDAADTRAPHTAPSEQRQAVATGQYCLQFAHLLRDTV